MCWYPEDGDKSGSQRISCKAEQYQTSSSRLVPSIVAWGWPGFSETFGKQFWNYVLYFILHCLLRWFYIFSQGARSKCAVKPVVRFWAMMTLVTAGWRFGDVAVFELRMEGCEFRNFRSVALRAVLDRTQTLGQTLVTAVAPFYCVSAWTCMRFGRSEDFYTVVLLSVFCKKPDRPHFRCRKIGWRYCRQPRA